MVVGIHVKHVTWRDSTSSSRLFSMASELLLPSVPEALAPCPSSVQLKWGVKVNPTWISACLLLSHFWLSSI